MDEAELMRQNDALVWYMVFKVRRRWPCLRRVPRADLLQSGRLGMLKAIRLYDESKGKWSPWLGQSIEWEILAQYGKRFQRNPLTHAWPVWDVIDPHDLAEELAERDEQAETSRRVHQALLELNEKPPRPNQSPLKNVRGVSMLRMRYGIDGQEHTLDAMGKAFKLTRERVRQQIIRATAELGETRALVRERQEFDARERARFFEAMKRRAEAERVTMRLIGQRSS